ncbi:MAG: hypothetical protein AUH33_01290 [Chloroflexi bacterium 13_1_40CM_68_21]|nr:MAG: hypothetical protein AUH33_01290 [Chloroflexi bacterium 13_1_40CM_68_21]
MSRDIADALRATARERRSFIVMAVPRLAGKSTVLRAMVAERPKKAPLRTVAEDGDDIEQLLAESRRGYIVIPEISRGAHAPGYIWGAPVRRIFGAIGDGASLAVALHAPGPEEAFDIICRGCGVSDADASKISLVVYLRSLGHWEEPTRRVVETVHEIKGVRDGQPQAKLLFLWDERTNRFSAA